MTHYLGVRDPGRSGGSWLMYLCNVHPAGMLLVGEPHLPTELGFPYPCDSETYDRHVIRFMLSQTAQGKAVTGIVKCFRPWAAQFIIEHGGRIFQLVRNPMEVVGSNMGKKPGSDLRYLGHRSRDENDNFRAHCMYYREAYGAMVNTWRQEPIVRIEDFNRSCGSDGAFLKAVMEYVTQTEWPDGYIQHICKTYLPGYFYGLETIRENGIVVGIKPDTVLAYESWRMNWFDDPRAGEYWAAWGDETRAAFVDILGPVCDRLGYNCRDRPGHVDADWPLVTQYAWKAQAAQLKPIPYEGDVIIRGSFPHGKPGLPAWRDNEQ